MKEEQTPFKANDHLANERTYLAWVRTGVGIMAFGFVVAKFSLFVTQISVALGTAAKMHTPGYARIIGVVLVVVGAASIMLSFVQYRRTEKQLRTGSYMPSSWLPNLLTAIIAVMSIVLITYLIESVYR
jgi:putative membrane protein